MTTISKTAPISEVMTPNPVTMPSSAPLLEAARTMKDRNVGDVIVLDGDAMCGVVTDRDIVVRAVAEGRDPARTTLGDICTRDLVALERTATVEDAVQLMRERAVRRLPITASGKPVGIVSLGDLAISRDPGSALADISGAPANS